MADPGNLGTLTRPNGENYIGEFKDSKYHGHGTLTLPNGQKQVGEFKNGAYRERDASPVEVLKRLFRW